jgi:prepilin peptidase CpaA
MRFIAGISAVGYFFDAARAADTGHWIFPMPDFLHVVVFSLCPLIIFSDLYQRRVRNDVLLAALLTGIGWLIWVWTQQTAAPLVMAAIGLLIGFFVLMPFYLGGWMGAGDVKFFATLGFLLGGKALLPVWIIASLLGGVHAVMILMSRALTRHPGSALAVVQSRFAQSLLWQHVLVARQARKGLPYAAYMAVGALMTMTFTTLTHW